MANERTHLRGAVLTEDRRTERFIRALLEKLGFNKSNFRFLTAPAGEGDACAWVRLQYPSEVRLMRRKRYQRLALIAVRDGDNQGILHRKSEMDKELGQAGLRPRQKNELIVLPVPTWSIETWLLGLPGVDQIDEMDDKKREFEKRCPGKDEGECIRSAAAEWPVMADRYPSVPSLADSKTELQRIQ